MPTITMKIRLSPENRAADCIYLNCSCGLRQFISDQDASIPGVFECECGRPFAIADIYGNVFPIGPRLRKGVDKPG